MKVIPIQGVGKVAFPHGMKDEDIQAATQKMQSQRPVGLHEVLQHLVAQEPKKGNSESYAKMSDVAKVLEQTPALLQLASAGLQASSQIETSSGKGTGAEEGPQSGPEGQTPEEKNGQPSQPATQQSAGQQQ